MLYFCISCFSDDEKHDFKEVLDFFELISRASRAFDYKTIAIAPTQNNPPDDLCRKNRCWYLPSDYEHVLKVGIRNLTLERLLPVLDAVRAFCSLLGYDVQLKSSADA